MVRFLKSTPCTQNTKVVHKLAILNVWMIMVYISFVCIHYLFFISPTLFLIITNTIIAIETVTPMITSTPDMIP